ncbi:hypothetical protein J8273_0265 [Carpediemonas membranifera]|uniref:Uncharacterized protein n=1 Tax=Carpediemonas membranifera TaxID=201153 RepID=A0A8J6E323_9EUKA|nr:hypothetical protein J8273_0265 [Carpediemonas membranifera]|eukprot:KAG9395051.1 hypothetical protein J8273_0265 [Carpediemonas membranifera]
MSDTNKRLLDEAEFAYVPSKDSDTRPVGGVTFQTGVTEIRFRKNDDEHIIEHEMDDMLTRYPGAHDDEDDIIDDEEDSTDDESMEDGEYEAEMLRSPQMPDDDDDDEEYPSNFRGMDTLDLARIRRLKNKLGQ